MRVLVTGSSGRVGSAVVKALLAAGHVVRGFDLRASGRTAARYDEITASLDNPAAAQAATEGVEAVLHLGAVMSWHPAVRAAMFQTNVEGTRVLLDAAAASGVRRVVFASSGEVYPETAPLSLPIAEDHPRNANSPYGMTKLLGEELVRFHQRIGAFETVILRFSHTQDATELLDEGSVFSGPRFFLRPRIRQQDMLGNATNVARLQAAEPGEPAHVLARNEEGRPYQMHITETRDIVSGVLLALDHPAAAGETFNLGATDPIDFGALLPAMAQITGYPVVAVDFPGAGVYYRASNQKIRDVLGFEPEWTIDKMLAEAADAWARRATT